jgi:polar amino acid transport system substrate-binding protein
LRRAIAFLLLVALLGVVAACGGDDDDEAAPAATATGETETDVAATTEEEPDPCAKEELVTVADGSLTIATDNPAFPPWFQDAEGAPWDPTTPPTGLGYEAAVADAVAEQLGFAPDEVRWVVVPFNNVFKPGPKEFDFDINQVSYLPERDEAVDFSDSYYDVEQAVVTLKSSEFAGATSLAELQAAKLGAQVGTTSYNAIVDLIQPTQDPRVFDTNNDAITALKTKQIDGIVVDFPSTGYITNVQVPNATVVGRLPAGEEYFGLVFEEGNPLRDCANEAIAALQADGSIEQFQEEWINTSAPPVLE